MPNRVPLLAPLPRLVLALLLTLPTYCMAKSKPAHARVNAPVAPAAKNGMAEARLLEVYHLMSNGRSRDALALATQVVHDHPNFQLAQLVYGDLLAARIRPIRTLGDVPT